MPYKKISGIYRIINKNNNKVYIGSAVSVYNRLSSHKGLLKQNKHFNAHLQSAYNKYGIESFIFEIIEEIDDVTQDKLIERENNWIQYYKAYKPEFGYNKRIDAYTNLGRKYTDEQKKRLSISHLGIRQTEETKRKISISQYKPVCQYNLDGTFIAEYPSMLDAELKTGIYKQAISGCCRKVTKTAYGYIWKYKNKQDEYTRKQIKISLH